MGRTCVILSGLPRHFSECSENIISSLIDPNDADVFIHSWLDTETHPDVADSIVRRFSPKAFLFEKQGSFVNDHMELGRMMASHGRGYSRENFVTMVHSSWYSLLQANLLKERHRLANNIRYDWVIRARFDITYSHPITCSDFDPSLLMISNRNAVPNKGPLPMEMVDDRFAFSSNANMNLYCGGFNLIESVHREREAKDGIFCGETLVYEMAMRYRMGIGIISDLVAFHVG